MCLREDRWENRKGKRLSAESDSLIGTDMFLKK